MTLNENTVSILVTTCRYDDGQTVITNVIGAFFKHFVANVHNALCQLIKICVVHKERYVVSATSE